MEANSQSAFQSTQPPTIFYQSLTKQSEAGGVRSGPRQDRWAQLLVHSWMLLESNRCSFDWCACTTLSCTLQLSVCKVSKEHLLWCDSRAEWIQVMTFQVREENFDRGELEVVWTKIHQWHFQLCKFASYILTSMVRCVVKHDHCVLSPTRLLCIQMLNQLDDEEQEGVSIILAFVDCKVKFAKTANASNDIEWVRPLCQRCFVLHSFDQPTSLAMLRDWDDAFINVDDPVISLCIPDVLSSCILTLHQRINWVVELRHRSQLAIGDVQLLGKVPMHHCCRHLESHLILQDALQVVDLDWHLCVEQLILDAIACAFMKFHMPWLRFVSSNLLLRIFADASMNSLHLLVRDA